MKIELFSHEDDTPWMPDCSSITDSELAKTIFARWPIQDGKVYINYVFSLSSYFDAYASKLRGYFLQETDTQIDFRNAVRRSFQLIAEKNNGLFVFNEISASFATEFSPFFRGISLAQTASVDHFAGDDAYGFTLMSLDNDGYLRTPQIHLPTDADYVSDAFTKEAIAHEIYHALGAAHLHEFPDTLDKLRKINGGTLCSIMPYYDYVINSVSSCHCSNPFLSYPGPLDTRSMDQAYNQNHYDSSPNFMKIGGYAKNIASLFIFFIILNAMYKSADDMLGLLAVRKNKPFLPKKLINLILDVNLLVVLTEMEAPNYISIGFAIAAAARLIPERITNLVPGYTRFSENETVKRGYSHLRLLGILSTINEGVQLVPFVLQLAMILMVADMGTNLSIGKYLAAVFNFVLQGIGTRVLDNTPEAEDLDAAAIELEPSYDYSYALPDSAIVEFKQEEQKDDEYGEFVSANEPDRQLQASSNPHAFYNSKAVATRLKGLVEGLRYSQLEEVELSSRLG